MSERRRTRDLLLEYDQTIMPLRPHMADLGSIYHWENLPLSIISKQLFMNIYFYDKQRIVRSLKAGPSILWTTVPLWGRCRWSM